MSGGFLTRMHLAKNFLPSSLVSRAQYKRIENAASQLPDIGKGMLEFRVEPHHQQVDFGIVLENEQAFAGFANMDIPTSWTPDLQKKWEKIKRLCTRKAKGEGFLRDALYSISIAYDLGDHQEAVPWLYYGISPSISIPSIQGILIKQLLQDEEKLTLNNKQYRLLDKVLHTFPMSVKIVHVAYLGFRQQDCIRIVGAPFHEMEVLWQFLEMLDWNPHEKLDKEILEACFLLSEFCQVSLDICEELLPKIGLEFWFPEDQDIIEIGLRLSKFPGFPKSPELLRQFTQWPKSNPNRGELRRWINHIKLSIAAKGDQSLKCYFSFK